MIATSRSCVAVLLVLMGGLQGRPWAIWVNLAVQVIVLAGFAIYPGIGFIGVLFAGLWGMIAYFRAEVRRRQGQGFGTDHPPG